MPSDVTNPFEYARILRDESRRLVAQARESVQRSRAAIARAHKIIAASGRAPVRCPQCNVAAHTVRVVENDTALAYSECTACGSEWRAEPSD